MAIFAPDEKLPSSATLNCLTPGKVLRIEYTIEIVLPQALLDQHLKTVVFWPEMKICGCGCSQVLILILWPGERKTCESFLKGILERKLSHNHKMCSHPETFVPWFPKLFTLETIFAAEYAGKLRLEFMKTFKRRRIFVDKTAAKSIVGTLRRI